ncbi:MAG: hypothetical protein IPP79_23450 [Chitinophagaceae bacterium]|nr:hypothetical protein [Chitinophagaceae bacterium]
MAEVSNEEQFVNPELTPPENPPEEIAPAPNPAPIPPTHRRIYGSSSSRTRSCSTSS